MRNLPPQHSFDFKVNVNYQTGNVAIRGPNQYYPKKIFLGQQKQHYTLSCNSQPSISTSTRPSNYLPHPNFVKQENVNQVSVPYNNVSDNSPIYCIICNKSYTSNQFSQHLQLHRRRNKNYLQGNRRNSIEEANNCKSQSYPLNNGNPMIRYNTIPQFPNTRQSEPSFQQEYSFQKIKNSSHHSSVYSKHSSKIHSNQNSLSIFVPIEQNLQIKNKSQIQLFQNKNMSNSCSRQSSFYKNQSQNGSQFKIFVEQEINSHKNSSFYSQKKVGHSSNDFKIQENEMKLPNQMRAINTYSSEEGFDSSNKSGKSGNFSYNYQKQPNFHKRFHSNSQKFSEDDIIQNNAFKRKNQHTFISLKQESKNIINDVDSESSQGDIKQTLDKISRDQMFEISQLMRHSSVYCPAPYKSSPSTVIFPRRFNMTEQTSGSQNHQNQKSKPLSSHLNQLRNKEIQSSKLFRGVQVNSKQIQMEVELNSSEISKTTKSTKMKMPKNSLAIFQHLNSHETQINSLPKKSIRSLRSFN